MTKLANEIRKKLKQKSLAMEFNNRLILVSEWRYRTASKHEQWIPVKIILTCNPLPHIVGRSNWYAIIFF